MDLLRHPASGKEGAGDEQGVLEIDLILFVVAVIRKLGIACQCELAGAVRAVLDRQVPDLVGAV